MLRSARSLARSLLRNAPMVEDPTKSWQMSRQPLHCLAACSELSLSHLVRQPVMKPLSHLRPSLASREIATSAAKASAGFAALAGTVLSAKAVLSAGWVGEALRLSALVIAGMNTVGFVITGLTKSHKITDLTGTSAFIGSVWATHIMSCHATGMGILQPSKGLLLTVMVTLWGARLAGYLFHRVLQTGKDSRLDFLFPQDDKEPLLTGPSRYPLRLAGFWAVQGLWAWLVCIPVTVAHATLPTLPLSPITWLATAGWAIGFAMETLADYQKSEFKAQPGNKDKFIDTGLYKYSRYPNYFGEILTWTSLYVVAGVPQLWYTHPWIAVSPGFTAILLLYVSGVPVTEKSQAKRYGDDPRFQEYKATTSTLIPLPKFRRPDSKAE